MFNNQQFQNGNSYFINIKSKNSLNSNESHKESKRDFMEKP